MYEIPKILELNEKVLWEGRPRYAAWMAGPIVLIVLLLFVGFIFGPVAMILIVIISIAELVYFHLAYIVTHYALTNKRAIFQFGIIGRDFRSVDYDQVQNASVDVNLVGLIFNVGTVGLFTGELESYKNTIGPRYDSFTYIENPYATLKLLQQHLSLRKETMYGGFEKTPIDKKLDEIFKK